MDGAHVLVAALGELSGRGVHERAEAPEQQEREIGARARHGRRLRRRLDKRQPGCLLLDSQTVELRRDMTATPAGPAVPEVTHHRADVNGTTLHYVAAGTTGSPILLVHGFPETWRAFRKLIPRSPPATRSSPWTCAASATPTPRQATTTARPARPGCQPGRAAWPRSGEGASRPRARARSTVSNRRCVPSLAYRWRMWVLTVLCETCSSLAICCADRLVGR